ncbi:hypothetical protein EJ02DRAFT_18650 [Clathrospora elynae]|uniref:Uncharacterized protein n=1 Tax=Clathrospora elynae TaxID=706981 RepID=A0A6A5SJE8_9PLEO|nr:hypothetical protein EJ02DRAFT_18650 [Clathrospora elynae]
MRASEETPRSRMMLVLLSLPSYRGNYPLSDIEVWLMDSTAGSTIGMWSSALARYRQLQHQVLLTRLSQTLVTERNKRSNQPR